MLGINCCELINIFLAIFRKATIRGREVVNRGEGTENLTLP